MHIELFTRYFVTFKSKTLAYTYRLGESVEI